MAKKRITQRHHFSYEPEIVGRLYKGEHEILGKINMYTRNSVSAYFIKCLKAWIVLNEDRVIDLDDCPEIKE